MFEVYGLMLPALELLFDFSCDAPFNFLFTIKQLRRSLPRPQVKISEAYLKLADAVPKGRTLVRLEFYSPLQII